MLLMTKSSKWGKHFQKKKISPPPRITAHNLFILVSVYILIGMVPMTPNLMKLTRNRLK